MKIQKIAFRNHFLFGSIDIDLVDSNCKPLSTIVFAGNNGCGKTTLLVEIMELMTGTKGKKNNSFAILNMQSLVDANLLQLCSSDFENEPNFVLTDSLSSVSLVKKKISKISEDNRPKVIYLPAEISFDKLTVKEKVFDYKYSFKNVIDKKHVNVIPTYISSIIKDAVFKNEDLPAKTSIKKVCAEINRIFEDLEIDATLTGLAEEGEKLPVFCC